MRAEIDGVHASSAAVPAVLVLRGQGRSEVLLELVPNSRAAWMTRTVWFFVHWIGATVVTAVFTMFDPHILILPVLIGGAWFFQSWRRRYRVARFRGSCPRCGHALEIPPGSWIGSPHRLDCFQCHFEPELLVEVPPA